MTLIRFGPVMTEAIDSSKSHVKIQNMCTMEVLRGHGSEVEGLLRAHQKSSSRKGGRTFLQSLEWFQKLLPVSAANNLNASWICIQCFMRDDAEDQHPKLLVSGDGTEKVHLNNKNRKCTIAFRFPRHVYI